MGMILQLLQVVASLGALACFILVVVKMFQHGDTNLGIACVVLIFCGIGGLIAFVMGWVKSSQYDIKNVMLAWTGCIVLAMLFGGGAMVLQFREAMNGMGG